MAHINFCRYQAAARIFLASVAGAAWCAVGMANGWRQHDHITISGSPPTSVTAGQAYSFTPTASDSQGRTLAFAISNMPSWATFNAGTGQLSGTPPAGSVGSYANIVIAASDGRTNATLPAFTVQVLAG